MSNFQYPQSDRSLCRATPAARLARKSATFSILSRIEASAAAMILSSLRRMSNFQYPQSDRSLCRCEWSPARLGQSFSFSILSRIEASAARQRFQHVYQRDPLSVSSVGSKPLPLDKHLLYIYFIQAFSILSRIEASAAERCNYAALLTCNTFSILSRIEASAAVPALLRSTMRFLFQYPQSDRSLCRTVCSLLACRGVTTFSILSRIEASAASLTCV